MSHAPVKRFADWFETYAQLEASGACDTTTSFDLGLFGTAWCSGTSYSANVNGPRVREAELSGGPGRAMRDAVQDILGPDSPDRKPIKTDGVTVLEVLVVLLVYYNTYLAKEAQPYGDWVLQHGTGQLPGTNRDGFWDLTRIACGGSNAGVCLKLVLDYLSPTQVFVEDMAHMFESVPVLTVNFRNGNEGADLVPAFNNLALKTPPALLVQQAASTPEAEDSEGEEMDPNWLPVAALQVGDRVMPITIQSVKPLRDHLASKVERAITFWDVVYHLDEPNTANNKATAVRVLQQLAMCKVNMAIETPAVRAGPIEVPVAGFHQHYELTSPSAVEEFARVGRVQDEDPGWVGFWCDEFSNRLSVN